MGAFWDDWLSVRADRCRPFSTSSSLAQKQRRAQEQPAGYNEPRESLTWLVSNLVSTIESVTLDSAYLQRLTLGSMTTIAARRIAREDGINSGRSAEHGSAHLPVQAPRAVEPGFAAVLPGRGPVGLVGRARLAASQRAFGPSPHLAVLFEGLWALCEAIEAVLLDPSAQAVIYRLKLSSVALVPPSLLFFVLEYTSRTGAAPARFKVLILAVPAISISLIATSGEHRLFLTGMEQVEIGGYRLLSPRYGPAFWIHTSYCYALLCAVRLAARPLGLGIGRGLEEADAVLVRVPAHPLGHQRGGHAEDHPATL